MPPPTPTTTNTTNQLRVQIKTNNTEDNEILETINLNEGGNILPSIPGLQIMVSEDKQVNVMVIEKGLDVKLDDDVLKFWGPRLFKTKSQINISSLNRCLMLIKDNGTLNNRGEKKGETSGTTITTTTTSRKRGPKRNNQSSGSNLTSGGGGGGGGGANGLRTTSPNEVDLFKDEPLHQVFNPMLFKPFSTSSSLFQKRLRSTNQLSSIQQQQQPNQDDDNNTQMELQQNSNVQNEEIESNHIPTTTITTTESAIQPSSESLLQEKQTTEQQQPTKLLKSSHMNNDDDDDDVFIDERPPIYARVIAQELDSNGKPKPDEPAVRFDVTHVPCIFGRNKQQPEEGHYGISKDKRISRDHIKLEWDSDRSLWTLVILGKKHVIVNGVQYHGSDDYDDNAIALWAARPVYVGLGETTRMVISLARP
jgi:hypothetical protein